MSDQPLPSNLIKHLKLANIQGVNIIEKLHERRLVQIVSYLQLVSVKLRHKKIHRDAFRQRVKDNIAAANHSDLLNRSMCDSNARPRAHERRAL